MIFRGIDGDGDWQFGNGVGSYFKGARAVDANIRTRLLVFLGECFFALDAGVDWWNLLGGKNPQAQAGIILQCRTIIAASYGVVRINQVQAQLNTRTRRLTVTYDINTIFTRNLSSSVNLPA